MHFLLDPYWVPPSKEPVEDDDGDTQSEKDQGASTPDERDGDDDQNSRTSNRGAFGCLTMIRPALKILQPTFTAIMDHLTDVEPEAGGILIGKKGSRVITHYVPDKNGRATAASFTLDASGLNRVLREFLACDMDCKGIVHSHPFGCTRPSMGDLEYVLRSFCNPKNKDVAEFLLPIVCGNELHPYIVVPGDPLRVLLAELVLV